MVRPGLAILWMMASVSIPAPAAAWGFDAHRFITQLAIESLPAPLRAFYAKNRVMVIEHSIDPDLWRTAGFDEEPPRHFVDLDAYGKFPFPDLPRDYDRAVAKFGRAHVDKYGTLPWRADEIFRKLAEAFSQARSGTAPWAAENAKFFSAVVSHYVGDAHQPLHAALNYDGQLTNQHGIHSRFETDLFLRYRARLRLVPPRTPPVSNGRDFVFDTLLDSFTQLEPVLAADLAAIGTGSVYDNAYYDRFFTRVRPVLERQLSRTIAGVAAVWIGAWEAGGRPDLSTTTPAPPRRKRAPAETSVPGAP
jgi:hypothetical protein